MKTLRIGLLGAGTVGCGTLELLERRGPQIAHSVGCTYEVARILVRDPRKPRPIPIDPALLTTDPAQILAATDIAIVVELIGGEQPAYRYIREALQQGKHVVTANKEVIAKHGFELLQLASQKGVHLLYEASVGGGIPVIDVLRRGLVANEIAQVQAIINGTTNYILTAMAEEGLGFEETLAQAQKMGYAEPDPTYDVSGLDAAYKLAILSTLAFRTNVAPDDVHYSGITQIEANDFRYAGEMGYVVKLLAKARRVDSEIEAWVHPVLLPKSHHLAAVNGVYNAVLIEGDRIGTFMLYGRGAGAKPTSSAVVADLCTIAQNLHAPPWNGGESRAAPHTRNFGEIESRHYLRLLVADQAGVLAQIGHLLGELNISISSVIQKETDETARVAELVMMTHPSKERQMAEALRALETLPVIKRISSFIRVEK